MHTYFVSGVNGVGKSTLIPHLRELLSSDEYIVYDFDQRGVPDGADDAWRMNEIKYWLTESASNATQGKKTVICGFAKKSDFEEEAIVELIVLHANPEIIRERLMKRYTKEGVFDENHKVIGKPVNEFIGSSVWYSTKMRGECEAAGCPIIDTSTSTPDEVAKKVVALIQKTA